MTKLKMKKNTHFWLFLKKIAPQAKGIAFPAKVLEKIIFLTSKLKIKKQHFSSFTLNIFYKNV